MTASTDVKDLYKAILLLQSLPPSFNRLKTGGFGKALAACGQIDNNIGGLFGKANFLGETSLLIGNVGTISAATGLSYENTTAAPPGTIPPTGAQMFSTGPQAWAAVLSTISPAATSISIATNDGYPLLIDVRDNFYWDDQTTLSWVPFPGCLGIKIGTAGGTFTFAMLEAAINSTSQLFRVTTPSPGGSSVIQELTTLLGPVNLDNVQDRSAIDQARDSMLVNTASGKALTDLGANYGVPRPPQSPFDDELFRQIIPVLAWLPKTPLLVTYKLAEVIFGTQAAVKASYGYAWQIYEVNPNEIIFECPLGLISGNLQVASYMHGYPGTTGAVTGPTNTITNVGSDARLSVSGSNLTGRTIYVFFGGVWNTYTISSSSYNAGTQTNTFILSAATVPTGDSYPFFIDVPGSSSWNPGDFMLADATVAADGTNPPHADLVYLFGKARLDIFEFYMNNFVRAAGVSLRSEVL